MSESVSKPPGGSPAGPPPEQAVAGQHGDDALAQTAPHQVAEVKVQALEALNSAFCQHIYTTALQYLRQNYNMDTIGQQFMDILDKDDPYDSPCSVANHSANTCKNRYRDVVPYDHNRVALPPLTTSSTSSSTTSSTSLTRSVGTQGSSSCHSSISGTSGDSSYINASFMSDLRAVADNSSQATGYIATQGPLPNTVADFWRMVSATNTSAIVMLTGLTDGSTTLGNSRPRCAAYFPDEEQDCLRLPGSITVTCVHKNNLDENVFFRQLEVVWAANPQQQRLWINHYQYSAWPDYGVPPSTHSVLALSHALDGCRRAGCKIVVHCSAGVGRTGTFVGEFGHIILFHLSGQLIPGHLPQQAELLGG